MPKVSVIVPVYGVEKYIERCVRSLFEQTLDEIEYLFIDDCTPDKSIEILKAVLEEYPKRKEQVIIHRMDQNSGQAKVREWGMRNATGEYLTHCDSDDWVEKTMYDEMYQMAINESVDMVCSDFFIEKEDCTLVYSRNVNGDNIHNFLLRKNKCVLWNKIIKRELFRNKAFVYPVGNMGEDMAIILQVLPFCNKIKYISKAYYHYLCNTESICHVNDFESVIRKHLQLKSNVDLIIDMYSKIGLYSKYKQEFVSLKYHVRKILELFLKQDLVYDSWKSTYPEIKYKVFFCDYISFRDRIKYSLFALKIIR